MPLSPSEFLAFARASQDDNWVTLSDHSPFRFRVSTAGLVLTPSTGKERTVGHAEIERFCAAHEKPEQERRAAYKAIFNSSYLRAIAARFSLDRVDFRFPEESVEDALHEGATKSVQVNAFERSPEARRRCIEAHGSACSVCSFDFGAKYGDFARGFIHVHHLTPLSTQAGEHQVDPVRDLRPICPNCHAVIHMRNGCLSIQEVKAMLIACA